MGCDIHDYCEVYKDGKWVMESGFSGYYDDTKISDHPYNGRNYVLFSLLADVRNSGRITPISIPRGVPKDASEAYKRAVNEYGCDGHSHSYLMLDELLSVDLNELIDVQGVVSEETYRQAKLGKIPESYCGGTSGPKTFVIKNNLMDELIKDRKAFMDQHGLDLFQQKVDGWKTWTGACPAAVTASADLEKFKNGQIDYNELDFHTSYAWKQPLGECVGSYFFEKSVPAMLEKSPSGDSIHVRYVFFFDN
jgi:hypothetical protein